MRQGSILSRSRQFKLKYVGNGQKIPSIYSSGNTRWVPIGIILLRKGDSSRCRNGGTASNCSSARNTLARPRACVCVCRYIHDECEYAQNSWSEFKIAGHDSLSDLSAQTEKYLIGA